MAPIFFIGRLKDRTIETSLTLVNPQQTVFMPHCFIAENDLAVQLIMGNPQHAQSLVTSTSKSNILRQTNKLIALFTTAQGTLGYADDILGFSNNDHGSQCLIHIAWKIIKNTYFMDNLLTTMWHHYNFHLEHDFSICVRASTLNTVIVSRLQHVS
ncbi:hypothetical protein BDC45DRAFT_597946 [Circinella umbellata]|nr:hypothetical protein BDC45DRAFT_597946 [Circinella umbellata]